MLRILCIFTPERGVGMGFAGPDIGDYYRSIEEPLRREVVTTPDEIVEGYDKEQWIAHLISYYGMETIQIDSSREPYLEDLGGQRPPARYRIPVLSSDTLTVIFSKHLGSHRIWMSHTWDEFSYDASAGYISIATALDVNALNNQKAFLNDQILTWNHDIDENNRSFPALVRRIVDRRTEEVKERSQSLTTLSEATGIKLVRKADLKSIVPAPVRVKKTVAPLLAKDRGPRPSLEAATLAAILELLDNQGRQFERTPTVFASLNEEDLRDVMLSSLNGVFGGDAVGEAFQGIGKTDIHLRISKGELFLAEVKWWDGPASVATATQQLLERLTWHESCGVVVILSRNANFGDVRKATREVVPTLPGSVGPTREGGEHHYISRFALPSDASRQVEVHFLLYNLYTPRPSGRSAQAQARIRRPE